MVAVVRVFSLMIIAISVYGFLRPRGYIAFARWLENGPGVWGGAAMRLAMAAVLWFAAEATRTPTTLKVLAIAATLGAVALPAMGQERFRRLIEWGAEQPPTILRVLCVLGVALGGFLLWSSSAA